MRSVFRSSFLWQFAGGFLLGAAGLLTLQPADATRTLAAHVEAAAHITR